MYVNGGGKVDNYLELTFALDMEVPGEAGTARLGVTGELWDQRTQHAARQQLLWIKDVNGVTTGGLTVIIVMTITTMPAIIVLIN